VADLWADISKQLVQGADVLLGAFIGVGSAAFAAYLAEFQRSFNALSLIAPEEVHAAAASVRDGEDGAPGRFWKAARKDLGKGRPWWRRAFGKLRSWWRRMFGG